MTKEDIKEQVQDIFRDLFDNESIVVDEGTTADDIEDWDSLVHISLITSIEKHFSVKFKMNEVMRFKNVGDMVDTIAGKVS